MSIDHGKGQNLDALLQDWSVRHALPAARAATIRQTVLQMPERPAPELPVAWWHRLFRPLTTTLPRSTDMAQYFSAPI